MYRLVGKQKGFSHPHVLCSCGSAKLLRVLYCKVRKGSRGNLYLLWGWSKACLGFYSIQRFFLFKILPNYCKTTNSNSNCWRFHQNKDFYEIRKDYLLLPTHSSVIAAVVKGRGMPIFDSPCHDLMAFTVIFIQMSSVSPKASPTQPYRCIAGSPEVKASEAWSSTLKAASTGEWSWRVKHTFEIVLVVWREAKHMLVSHKWLHWGYVSSGTDP